MLPFQLHSTFLIYSSTFLFLSNFVLLRFFLLLLSADDVLPDLIINFSEGAPRVPLFMHFLLTLAASFFVYAQAGTRLFPRILVYPSFR